MRNLTRPRGQIIRKLTAEEIGGAALVRLTFAAEKTGATEYAIRHSGQPLRRIGNADFVVPEDLNRWIEGSSTAIATPSAANGQSVGEFARIPPTNSDEPPEHACPPKNQHQEKP